MFSKDIDLSQKFKQLQAKITAKIKSNIDLKFHIYAELGVHFQINFDSQSSQIVNDIVLTPYVNLIIDLQATVTVKADVYVTKDKKFSIAGASLVVNVNLAVDLKLAEATYYFKPYRLNINLINLRVRNLHIDATVNWNFKIWKGSTTIYQADFQDESGWLLQYSFVFDEYANNEPPDTPASPDGLTSGYYGMEYQFTIITSDPEGSMLTYEVDWGDGTTTTTPAYSTGALVTAFHGWSGTGTTTYLVRVRAQDDKGTWSKWSALHSITLEEAIPTVPSISGPTNPSVDKSYSYSAVATNGGAGSIRYTFYWSDGTTWTSAYATYQTTPWGGLWKFLASDPIYILVDIAYMALLLVGGAALISGCFVRPASLGLTIFTISIYLALFPLLPPTGVPSYNPIVDDHIVYILLLIIFMVWPVGEWLGLGKKWSEFSIVKKYPFLK